MQAIVDELTPTLSGSRVRSVVNAVRSLYRWAQDRDLATHDPAGEGHAARTCGICDGSPRADRPLSAHLLSSASVASSSAKTTWCPRTTSVVSWTRARFAIATRRAGAGRVASAAVSRSATYVRNAGGTEGRGAGGSGLDGPLDNGERQVLQPVSRSLAFTFGLGGPLPAIGKGESVKASGATGRRTGFTYLGVRYLRVGPSANPSGPVQDRLSR